ncbi:hypothetical protein RJ640_006895 [Escallonia rubra]|uniref:Uncharacterized protein n=1 Tax=Escallonia rubra TaxID=112253 RepID=A0AA88RE20_9ASTE|nr:hypothetical protein RJ640_006895 [Escallonia rubra]
MVIPVQKVWVRLAKRLGIRKTGLVKLHHDVRTCEYEDVHVLWEMLKKNETGIARSAVGRKQGHLWNIVNWLAAVDEMVSNYAPSTNQRDEEDEY